MSSPVESSARLSPVEEAFAEFLDLEERGEADFESFCAARAPLADGLRRLHERWLAFDRAVSADLRGEPEPEADPASSADRLLRGLRRDRADDSRYEPSDEIGHGGMGRVLKVWDREMRRSLAMKVLQDRRKRDARSLARFLDEALVTGQLEHPGIVPVHELGLDAEGRVYFTMPFVRGESLQRILERVREGEPGWSRGRAIEVLLRVCEAVGYAHSRGVVHRDLKPANVMVGPFGETYVMDWGLARILGAEERGETAGAATSRDLSSVREEVAGDSPPSPLTTMEGDVVGTPIYMAPEQAHGWIEQVGPATDVYSIGAMLYQLLTGSRPYLGPGEESSAETVLRAVKSRAPRPVHALAADVPPELEAICDKAMARDPAARYPGTMELARDLRAFLEHRVVGAYQTGAFAELRMWVRRNRGLAAALGAAFAAVVLGLVAGTVLFLRAKHNEGLALDAQTEANENARRLAAELRASNVERGRMLARFGPVLQGEELLWTEFLKDVDDPHARWALWEMFARNPSLQTLRVDAGIEGRVRFAPGDRVLTFGDEGVLRSWRRGAFEPTREVPAHEGEAGMLAISPDGGLAATAGTGDGLLRLWRLPELAPVGTVPVDPAGAMDVVFAPDGERIAACGADGVVVERALPGLEVLREADLDVGPVRAVRYGPAGGSLWIGTQGGDVWLWREGGDAPERGWKAHGGRGLTVLAVADDGRVVTGGADRRLAAWSPAGELLVERETKNGTVRDVLLSADGRTLISGGWYTVDFRDAETLELLRSYPLPFSAHDLAVDESGKLLAVAYHAGSVRIFETERGGHVRALAGHEGMAVAKHHPDGRTIVTGDGAGVLRFFDVGSGSVLRSLRPHDEPIRTLDLSADGSVLATATEGGEVALRHLPTDRVLLELDGLNPATHVPMDLSADGGLFAMVVEEEPVVRLFEVATGAELAAVAHSSYEALSVAIFEERGLLATAARGAGVWLWTLAGEPAGRLTTSGTPWTLARDGRGRLATGTWSWAGHVGAPDPAAEDPWEARLEGHWGTVWHVALHPRDPNLAATTGDDRTVRLWDLASERAVLTLEVDALLGGPGLLLSFHPDGDSLAVSGRGDPIVLDLTYYDRHMAGNARHQLGLLRAELGGGFDEARLGAWVEAAGARPWPGSGR